jgi:hypothetical protein
MMDWSKNKSYNTSLLKKHIVELYNNDEHKKSTAYVVSHAIFWLIRFGYINAEKID